MKVVRCGARACRAKVEGYWCHRARNKMDPSAAPQAPHTVALTRQGRRSTPGKLSHCGTLRPASRWRCAMEVIHPRCCGIDIHKESVVTCLRLQEGRRAKTEVRRFGTTTAELLRLHEWLSHAGCTHVAMESTSVYWKPVFNLLEGSFEVVLANAYHIKAVPGRKTDVKDCEWIANLLAHGLIRASFIPPPPIRDLRDLTRHRKSLVRDRVKATNRVHKLLETANIKLANVVADVLGVSGRAMLDALVAGDTDPERLAKLAKGSLTPKVKPLAEALRGRFTSHHAFLLGQMLTQLDQLAALIAQYDVRIL